MSGLDGPNQDTPVRLSPTAIRVILVFFAAIPLIFVVNAYRVHVLPDEAWGWGPGLWVRVPHNNDF